MSEVSRITAASESVRKDKSALETQLKAAQEELNNIRGQLAAIETVSKPAPKVEEAKPQEVQLEKIIVAPKPQEEAPVVSSAVPLEGKVLVVNREYDFIVINLGQKDGVNLGDVFEVMRKDKSLGQAKVEEVRDTMSVATPGTKDMIKQIKEDDRVVRR